MTCSIDVHFGYLSSAAQVDLVTPNVEVTGAARPYRAASEWTAGLGIGFEITGADL
jgi:hypothetical protein